MSSIRDILAELSCMDYDALLTYRDHLERQCNRTYETHVRLLLLANAIAEHEWKQTHA